MLITGLLMGIGLTLSLQFLSNHRVRKALAEMTARTPAALSLIGAQGGDNAQ